MHNMWNGFVCEEFTFDGRDAIIVFPDTPAENSKIVLKTEYWNAFPDVEINLLKSGHHLAYIKNRTRFATKEDCDTKAAFIKFLAAKYKLSEKCIPVGMSCGGAHAVRFAGYYPELIACMYIDAPVLNFCDFPGKWDGDKRDNVWDREFVLAYPGIKHYQLLNFPHHPINMADTLIKNRIPIIMVYGLEDSTVIYEENGKLLAEAFEGTDLLKVIAVNARGHHPHGLLNHGPTIDNTEIVQFLLAHSRD